MSAVPLPASLPRWILAAILVASSLAAACSEDSSVTSGGASDGSSGSPGSVTSGEALYKQHCASCHGPTGEGGSGKKLKGWTKGWAELVSTIDLRMPPQDPKRCQGTCATDIAAYILANFQAEPLDCKGNELPPRRLRLLNRREYNATIRDLLRLGGSAAGTTCSTDADCAIATESCLAGVCQKDPCNVRTFIYPAQGKTYASVHVAGSFNGWAGTIAAGGWLMTYLPSKDVYVTKRTIASGTYAYKFVLDETNWVPDPANPKGEPDGFGGQNSLLEVSCESGGEGQESPGPVVDLAKNFPAESRPTGFSYDNNADAGLVTSVHVEQYLKASAHVAKLALSHAAQLVPCGSVHQGSCSKQFIEGFGRRAFRRPLTGAEVARYEKLAQGQPTHEKAVEAVVRAMVLSPLFLYRSELGVPQPDGSYRLTDHEIASALSYTFWGTLPDDELASAADQGKLSDPKEIEAQARRLLASPRARVTLGVFSQQWLGVSAVGELTRSTVLYPSWSASLGMAMAEETRRFVEHVIFDGSHKLDELLTADYSFVNAQLASIYGMSAPEVGFSKALLPPERRAGLLGQGSVLTSTAHSDQSSPIRRGLLVRERLLCQDLGVPPPNAGGVPEVNPNATTRERFRQHSSDPFCRSCHQYIDEVGFGMERFDAIGRYRLEENGQPIPPDGNMNDVEGLGTGTNGFYDTLPELAAIIAGSEAFHRCFTRQVYRFAYGALEKDVDLCPLQALYQQFAASGYDVRELLVAIVRSPGFSTRW
ncbi:MAG: DUF1592 domain-containing protein [Myxococcales bacterium]|nr:DUF1592 domain-containing protein [Polyangiaceae bacterium]MDW8248227.1 DUF1592 domain-containing protein [Myxococcales bacterium]